VKALFITGTDTDAGKTAFSCALVGRARGAGRSIAALKPVESGCMSELGALRGADASRLQAASGSTRRNCHYHYAQPLAPGVAAQTEGNEVDLHELVGWTHEELGMAELGLVEGAGGWEVPLSADARISTFAKALELPVLVVGRAGLGTINHTILSLRAIAADGCVIAGFGLSETSPIDPARRASNATEIERLATEHGIHAPYWGVLRHRAAHDGDAGAGLELTQVAVNWLAQL